MPRTQHIAALALTALALSACTRQDNDRLRLGDSAALSTFLVHTETLPPAGPSVTGLDRSNWEPNYLFVPVHGTANQPTYARSAFDLATLPRQRGEFPDAESSLDLVEPDASDAILFAFRTHGLAFVDAVLLLPRAVLRPFTATDWSPAGSYQRAPSVVLSSPHGAAAHAGCCEARALGCDIAPPSSCGDVSPDNDPSPETDGDNGSDDGDSVPE
jgi:hypothetical protein